MQVPEPIEVFDEEAANFAQWIADSSRARLIKETASKQPQEKGEVTDLRLHRDRKIEAFLSRMVQQQQRQQQLFTREQKRKIEAAISILSSQSDEETCAGRRHHVFTVSRFDAFGDAAGSAVAAPTVEFIWKRILSVSNLAVVFEVEPIDRRLKETLGGSLSMTIHLQLQEEDIEDGDYGDSDDGSDIESGDSVYIHRDEAGNLLLKETNSSRSSSNSNSSSRDIPGDIQDEEQTDEETDRYLERGPSIPRSGRVSPFDAKTEWKAETKGEEAVPSACLKRGIVGCLQQKGETGKETLERNGLIAPLYFARLGGRKGGDIGGTECAFFHRSVLFSPLKEADLSQLLRRQEETNRPFPREVTLHVMKRAMLALAALHAKGLLHNNVQLDSIAVSSSGLSYLSDLGDRGEIGDEAGIAVPFLLSPEQFQQAQEGETIKTTEETDAWQLGEAAFIALTGRHPYSKSQRLNFSRVLPEKRPLFEGQGGGPSGAPNGSQNKATHSRAKAIDIRAYRSPAMILQQQHVPADWVGIITSLLQPDPADRPTVRDLIAAYPAVFSPGVLLGC